jgi:nucleotide-binding universal stress UspA family protein
MTKERAMPYASFLVNVDNSNASTKARIALAGELARRFKARLIGLAAAAVQPPAIAEPLGAGVISADLMTAEEDQIRADLKTAESFFLGHSEIAELDCQWRSGISMPADALAREGRAADVIILGRDRDQLRRGIFRAADPGEVILTAGRPVLAVPPGTSHLAARHIVVGWKDTREARRAVADAMPFLAAAESVRVLEVVDNDDQAKSASSRVDDVVDFLQRHHVTAVGSAVLCRQPTPADELILAAEQMGADLIVSGGYGHTRLREWVFGGVTSDLLKRCPMCCLMSH